jgi:hypothetical protein
MIVQADLQYPPQFLNEWDDTPPLRSIFGGSTEPDIATATRYHAKSLRNMTGLSHEPPSSQGSNDTNRTTTSIKDQIKKVKDAVVNRLVSNL